LVDGGSGRGGRPRCVHRGQAGGAPPAPAGSAGTGGGGHAEPVELPVVAGDVVDGGGAVDRPRERGAGGGGRRAGDGVVALASGRALSIGCRLGRGPGDVDGGGARPFPGSGADAAGYASA